MNEVPITASHHFDRSLFNEKLDSFDQQWFGENSAGSLGMSKGGILHHSLGDKSFLTDSEDGELDRTELRKSTNPNTGGALEEALMRSPALRRAAKSTEAPKSVGRKRLSSFLKRQQEEQQQQQEKSTDPLIPPIWHYSDIMSVGVSLAADKTADEARKEGDDSNLTKHPSFKHPPAGNDLWDRATQDITTKAAHKREKRELRRRLTKKSPTGSSEEQHRRSKSEHRPRKTKSGPADMRLLLEKMKSKHHKIERLTQSEHPSGGRRDDSQPFHPKQKLGSRTDHSTTKSSEPRRSSSFRHREPSRANSTGRSERHRSSSTKRRGSKKKQRSVSLSRVDLYGSEPTSPRAGSPKRRSQRKGKKKRVQSGVERTEESTGSVIPKGSPKIPSLGDDGRLERLSRRQLMKRMDSEQSMQHSNAGGAAARLSQRSLQLSQRSLQLSQRSLQVPVESSSPRLRLRHRTPPRNLMSKIERPSQRNLMSKTESPVGSSPQTNRASRRKLLSKETEDVTGSTAQHRSAKSPNRRSLQLGENPLFSSGKKSPDSSGKVSRRVFMKRMESVNSFFGVGQGEIGAAYPTARQNTIVQLSDVRETNGNIDDLVINLRRQTKQSIMKKFKSCRNFGIGGLK